MTDVDPAHYTYRVQWIREDEEYVGTVAELPSLSWAAPSQHEALSGITSMVESVLEDMVETGERPPQPLSDRVYSGRFVVRVPPETHRRLVIDAAEQHVSLNRLVSDRLAGV